MGLSLALGAALAYGVSDFVGGVLSRRIGHWATAVAAQIVAVVVTTCAVPLVPGRPGLVDLVWGCVAGVGSGLGTVALYRGLAAGAMTVVAPLSALGSVAVSVGLGVALGDRPSGSVWVGLACAVPAIWLVSHQPGHAGVVPGRGIADGLFAGLAFGVVFVAFGRIEAAAGLVPAALAQVIAAATVTAAALAAGAVLRRPALLAVPMVLMVGAGIGAAVVFYQLAVGSQSVVVAGLITSLYPAATVLLAAAFLRERPGRVQVTGLALTGLVVALVALG